MKRDSEERLAAGAAAAVVFSQAGSAFGSAS
jgi:hypothetical protein